MPINKYYVCIEGLNLLRFGLVKLSGCLVEFGWEGLNWFGRFDFGLVLVEFDLVWLIIKQIK